MSRTSIAGFMMGVSVGTVVGYVLKPPDDFRRRERGQVRGTPKDTKEPAKRIPTYT